MASHKTSPVDLVIEELSSGFTDLKIQFHLFKGKGRVEVDLMRNIGIPKMIVKQSLT